MEEIPLILVKSCFLLAGQTNKKYAPLRHIFKFSVNYSFFIRKCEIFLKQNIFLFGCSICIPNYRNIPAIINFFYRVDGPPSLTQVFNKNTESRKKMKVSGLQIYNFGTPLIVNPLIFSVN